MSSSLPPPPVTELEFESRDLNCFSVDLSAEGAAQVRLDDHIALADGTGAEFYTATSCSAERVTEHAVRTGHGASVDVIGVDGADVVFRLTASGSRVIPAIERAGAVVTSMAAEAGVGRVTAVVPADVEAVAVADAARGQGYAVELVARRRAAPTARTFNHHGPGSVLRAHLTDRQWEVLVTAFERGYFEQPRRRTGEEIAAELGISSATFSQHLRAAQRAMLRVVLADEPGLPVD